MTSITFDTTNIATFTKPVLADSFSTTAVELLSVQAKNPEFNVDMIEMFYKELVESFYTQEEFTIVNDCKFGVMTINNGNSSPLLVITTEDNGSTVSEYFEKARAAFESFAEELGNMEQHCVYSKDGTVMIIAILSNCENTGNVIAF